MTERLTCERVHEAELIEQYAAGRLSEPNAEALEAHAFECDTCWQDIQEAVEIRAAMVTPRADTQVHPAPTQQARPRRWRPSVPLALAAVGLLGIGVAIVTQHRQTTERPTVTRSASVEEIRVTGAPQADGSFRVEWPAHPSASDYLVRLQVDGATVLTAETSELHFVLPSERLAAGSPVVVEVTAQSADGVTLAAGSLTLTGR